MATTDIVTGQYVRITQTAASLGDRIAARLVDEGIIVAYSLAMGVCLSITVLKAGLSNVESVLLFVFLQLLPVAFYSFFFEAFFYGQTPGKRFRHLRVVSIDGSQPTIGQLAIRWMFLIVDLWISAIGILPIALSRRHQRFGDMAAGTMVIHEDDFEKWSGAINSFYWLTPNYKPTYPEAQRLTEGQAHVISQTLEAEDGIDMSQVDRLTDRVSQLLNVKPQKSNLAFLTTVLHDYQYYLLDPTPRAASPQRQSLDPTPGAASPQRQSLDPTPGAASPQRQSLGN